MKEFFKWLGVNEKIAKIVVWILIMMVCLIIINVFLESIGAPYYKITIDNLTKTNENILLAFAIACLNSILSFYSIVLIVFKANQINKIFKYSILYIILNSFIIGQTNYAILQIFIFTYILIFCYLFSGKKWKYIIYGGFAIILNVFIQYIWYLYKVRFIDFNNLNQIDKFISTIDFYIIMLLIILIKEIYLKNWRDNNGDTRLSTMDSNIQKRSKISKKISKNVNEVKDKS